MQVFDMFAYVKLEDDPRAAPPAHPSTGWRERYSARQRIGGLVLVYARAAGQVQHIAYLPLQSRALVTRPY